VANWGANDGIEGLLRLLKYRPRLKMYY